MSQNDHNQNEANQHDSIKNIRLLDESDPSLTFLNTHVQDHDDEEKESLSAENRSNYEEETATEFSTGHDFNRDREENQDQTAGKGIGTMALVLSITSLFLVPMLLAPAGIITGFLSVLRGRKALGVWAILIGAGSLIATLVFTPYY